MIGHLPQFFEDFDGDGGLPFDHVSIVEGGQEVTALFGTELLRRGKRIVEIVALEFDLDRVAAEHAGFLDFLLRRGHGHENHALHPEMAAHEGHALRVIACRCADEEPSARISGQNLAHRVEGAAQLVGTHGGQILALEPDIGLEPVGQMRIAQQRGCGENLAHGAFGSAGLILKLGHSRSLAQLAPWRKPKLRPCRHLALRHKTR